MHRTVAGALALCSVASGLGCVHEYHPEYHPETSYSYVQNVITVVSAPPSVDAPSVALVSPPPVAASRAFPVAVAHESFRRVRAARPVDRPDSLANEPRPVQLAPMFMSDIARSRD